MAKTAERKNASLSDVGLDEEQGKRILYLLKLCRYFDERMEALYRQGRLPGAIYSGRGQEGTHVGVAFALRDDDTLFPTHRDLNAQFAKGVDLKRVMAQYWGRVDGYTRGRDGTATWATGSERRRSRSSPICRRPIRRPPAPRWPTR